MKLSSKKEKAENSSITQLSNLPCIAYFSTKTGNRLPFSTYANSDFSLYSYDLFVLNYNSHPEINLTDNPNSLPLYQAWSPDGKILAWMQKNKEYYGIEAFENGQKRNLVSSLKYSIWRYAWSPNSDQIAFVGYAIQDKKLTNLGIYILRIFDKSISKIFDIEPDKLFDSLYWVKNSLVWCNVNGTVAKLDITDLKFQSSPKIIFNQKNARCLKIVVSPNKDTLSGIVNKQNRLNIWIFDMEGNNPHKLIADENLYQSCVAFHPTDNNLLAFSSRVLKEQARLAFYHFNTKKITYKDLKSDYKTITEMSWSKDGRYITVECERRTELKNQASDILLYDKDNSQWINITDSKNSRDFAPVCRP